MKNNELQSNFLCYYSLNVNVFFFYFLPLVIFIFKWSYFDFGSKVWKVRGKTKLSLNMIYCTTLLQYY